MTVDTIFDLASLTKVVVTTTAAMMLVEEGRIRLRDQVAHYLRGFSFQSFASRWEGKRYGTSGEGFDVGCCSNHDRVKTPKRDGGYRD